MCVCGLVLTDYRSGLTPHAQIELSELGLLVPDSSSLDPAALTTARASHRENLTQCKMKPQIELG